MSTTRLSFSYPEEMKEKLLVLAEKDCRSLSSYIQKVLLEHIRSKEHKVTVGREKRELPKKKRVVKRKKAEV